MDLNELETYIDDLLEVKRFKDASLNGLQVEGTGRCRCIATAATASFEAIRSAIDCGADTLIVHHGLFWKGALLPVSGYLKDRLNAALEANLNLLAYHLPLDANFEIGNNRCLCDLLGLGRLDYVRPQDPLSIGLKGQLEYPESISDIAQKLKNGLDSRIAVLGGLDKDTEISKIAVCSGAGSFLIDDSVNPDFQALVTGEANEQTYHLARESGVAVFVTGHHASEQGGIMRLGEHLSNKFSLEHRHLHFAMEKDVQIYE